MRSCFLMIAFIMLAACWPPASAADFDPAVDGWYFSNWGEASEFTWDLYRKTYLGINPTHDCIEAPLDCAFYEIFKNCAQQGNCGGMSLLALALYKYGGYMGFCSPACFYTGVEGPDRTDLHQAINILQARQFSASGIEHFLDTVDAGDLNDAVAAFNKIRSCLATGDYAVLSIATDAIGGSAHTVIPYKVQDGPGGGYPKKIYIWDSNFEHNRFASHYDGVANVMTINSATNWTYTGATTYSGSGAGGAWCFAIPMSVVLPKSRQPIALDMVFDALMTAFVTGTGCAVSQITDEQGRRFYKTDADVHSSGADLETDPSKRLKGVGRWQWYAQRGAKEPPGELYFIRRPGGRPASLSFTFSGKAYRATIGGGRDVIQIDSKSAGAAKDIVTVSGLATAAPSVRVTTLAPEREFTIKQIRQDSKSKDWRSIEVKSLKAARDVSVTIEAVGNLESVAVFSGDKPVSFDVDAQERINGQHVSRKLQRVSTTPGKLMMLRPRDRTTLEKMELQRPKLQ